MNIFLEPGQIFRVVHHDEPLQEHFLIREKYERPMISQSKGWDTTFKGDSWLGTAWHTVDDELPAWIGKSIDDFNNFAPGHVQFNYEVIEILEI